ncbi:uncharacterized protein MKK02DRAFT_17763 [Dioszegia hungarica]|uniref:Malic enzyme n=1 Tax=Dioszegia hungarica TaxID=4972 RepID=A0AA38LSJ3_9TREE|nr:uncharacterized protein MKK02DRAFT_17763 [Dioszegia hungarica]KAI9634110.1 hypothetical protein MKK02DRAFT_17763 [Dioszegia hungarica]
MPILTTMAKQAVSCRLRGAEILQSPRWNKGTAFTAEERSQFGIRGRLPIGIDNLDQQCERAYDQYKSRDTDILKNSFLQSLKSQNWTLFYALLSRHTSEMYPIIYTPTEAEAISEYSHLFRRSEGLFLSAPYEDQMEEDFLDAVEGRELELIVVSDAEAILGIGDQGSGGIGISAAKAVIYTLAAGIDPASALAVTLDVGTNNDDLLKDELYLGYQEKRIRGEKYDRFVDKFVGLVRKHQPNCLLHFEDFGVSNANRLLNKYRDKHSVFNDDVQGTGAVTLRRARQAPASIEADPQLKDQRIVIFGAGSAGMGIARQLRDAIKIDDGLSAEEAAKRFWMVDRDGLLRKELGDKIRDEIETDFVRKEKDWEGADAGLAAVIKRVKPTVLIGTSTSHGAFSEEIVRDMSKNTDRPIIFPLSNPISKCEAEPKDLFKWSDGKALISTGSPFPPVKIPGSDKEYIVAECNNALIYPGLGRGTILSKAKFMTDKMIVAGANRLAELAPAMKDHTQALLPDFGDAASVNFEVSLAVLDQAIEEGVAKCDVPKEDRRKWAEEQLWVPRYQDYTYDPKGEA